MKLEIDVLELFKGFLSFILFSVIDLMVFYVFLHFFGPEKAHLFAGIGLGCIFYHFSIKVGAIKYD